MRSRWDMQDDPPDISNYELLDVEHNDDEGG